MKPLENVLDEAHKEADVLKRNGLVAEAAARERVLRDIENATVEWRNWLTEDAAALRSGKSANWFRVRFPQWETQDLARLNPERPRQRQYRAIVVPMRANLAAARDDARRAAQRTMERAY
ncbi:MAG TPA: hypothetical protein VH539_07005 [Gemmatimonadaceae bacterium]|jgi:hypothetical protein